MAALTLDFKKLTKFFKSKLFLYLPNVGHFIKSCKESIGVSTFQYQIQTLH